MNADVGGALGTAQDDGGPEGRGRVLARIAGNQRMGRLCWLTVEIPGWIEAQPGQFALLQAEPSCCFLPRALSVADEATNGVSFLIDPVGPGTRELCGLGPGDAVWALGPLGHGFDLDAISGNSGLKSSGTEPGRSGRILLAAGGVGVAPFPLFLSRLAHHKTALAARTEVVALLGFRDATQAKAVGPLEKAVARCAESGLSCRLVPAAEDGSLGPAQVVTDLLERELRPGDRVTVCGPAAMSAAVWGICSRVEDVSTWFSLEANLACGVGSCHGCAIVLADGSFARVCREGPVFPGVAVFPAPLQASGRQKERT